jgi:GDP-4-dehydro-6-deoxy-D-mannose reductase
MSSLTPSRILITGISGFVGPYLAQACHNHYPWSQLYGMGHQASNIPPLESIPLIYRDVNILDSIALQNEIEQIQPDIIFHLAAQSSVAQSWKSPVTTLMVNAGGTVNLFEALHTLGLKPRIIVVGSGEQYGRVPADANPISEYQQQQPANPYAISKVTQDLFAAQYYHSFDLPIIRARPFNHFGPFQSSTFVIASFCQQIAQIEAGKMPPVIRTGNLQAQRDFLPVQDVVEAYVELAEQGHPGEAYNIGAGQARSIGSLLERLIKQARVSITTEIDPERMRPLDMPLLVADVTLIREHTQWRPLHDFDNALQETLNYWRSIEFAPSHLANN